MFVGNIQISGFQSMLEGIQLEASLEQALFELYPKLSLPELARLTNELQRLGVDIRPVLTRFGFRDNEVLRSVLTFLVKLPPNIQDYFSEKDFHLNDVRTILPLHGEQYSEVFLNHCVSLRMSKSQIIEACELANELTALGGLAWDEKLDRDQLLESLRQMRFPLASQKDRERNQNTKNQKWPSRAQVRWHRQGDLSGLEVKFFASSPNDFKRAVDDLTKVSPEEIWK